MSDFMILKNIYLGPFLHECTACILYVLNNRMIQYPKQSLNVFQNSKGKICIYRNGLHQRLNVYRTLAKPVICFTI